MTEFSIDLKTHRERSGLTQLELSRLLGISQTSIALYEKGVRIPSTQVLIDFADFFQIPVDQLIRIKKTSISENAVLNRSDVINDVLICLKEKKDGRLIKIFEMLFREVDIRVVIEGYISPILYKIGEQWEKGEISEADEHYATQMIRKIVNHFLFYFNMDRMPVKAIALATQSERHTIGLEMIIQYLAHKGVQTLYLGENVPMRSLEQFTNEYKPYYVFISITLREHVNNLLYQLEKLSILPVKKIFIGGQGIDYMRRLVKVYPKVVLIDNIEQLDQWID